MKKLPILLLVFMVFLSGCSAEGNASDGVLNGDKGNEQSESALKSDKESNKEQDLKDVDTGENDEDSKENLDENTEKDWAFETNSISIAMNSEAEPIIKSLKEPMDYFEAKSCAFQGLDKIYTYNGFEVHTYESDGVDHILAVMFLDDSVSTKEGIYLYSDLDSVLEAYGDDYTEKENVYTYKRDESQLSFMIEDDEVVSIEYMAITE